MIPLPIQYFGWQIHNDKITVDWDSPENILKIKKSVAFLTHGCCCKTGCKTGCSTKRCKCVKSK